MGCVERLCGAVDCRLCAAVGHSLLGDVDCRLCGAMVSKLCGAVSCRLFWSHGL